MQRSLNQTEQIINIVSPSFCAAKWYNATIWLGNGRTASCHHPAAHYIPVNEIHASPSALHNTAFKKERRVEMLEGKRCDECSYCWRVEDNNEPGIFSDRVYKSHIYTADDILKLQEMDPNDNIDPKTLEISFDNLCNLSCTYCNAEFSSTWASDIKSNGPYQGMQTDGGHTYENFAEHAMPFGPKNEDNLFIKKFFEWFHSSLKGNLQELRVTGGEPSRSPYFWKLLDECEGTNFDFAVNSNLMMDQERIGKLIEAASRFENFDLYTSCESYGAHAEFVRHGLKYDQWRSNLIQFTKTAKYRRILIMMTISALSIWSITDFMTDVLNMRKEVNLPNLFNMSLNILRFPSLQSINMITQPEKNRLADKIEEFATNRCSELQEAEHNQILRLVSYLRNVDRAYEDIDSVEAKTNDLVNFVEQYAQRRNMKIENHFPLEFLEWYKTLTV
jgi:organic radical activating enzyme